MASKMPDQAGLEVVPDQGSLEVLHTPEERLSNPEKEPLNYTITREPVGFVRRKRWVWVVGIAVAILVVIGAVLGGVLGSRAARNDSSSAPPPTTESKPNATLIMANSGLTATGWRADNKSYIRLFYQGKDTFVYYSGWNSSTKQWATPVQADVGAVSGTPMGACVVFSNGLGPAQVQFYYKAPSNLIRGENFQPSFIEGKADSIVNYTFTASDNSRIGSYWPTTVYQDSSSEIRRIWLNPNTFQYDSSSFAMSELGVVGSKNSPLVVLPMRALHPTGNQTKSPDMKLFYRRDNGNIYEFNAWADRADTKNKALPGYQLGANNSMAGFSNARSGNNNGTLNTYLIYQADNGNILWGSDTSDSGWTTPKAGSVFDGADKPTNLACVTMAGSTNPDIPLTSATDLNRCYFQKDGRLMEATFDGSKWNGPTEIHLA